MTKVGKYKSWKLSGYLSGTIFERSYCNSIKCMTYHLGIGMIRVSFDMSIPVKEADDAHLFFVGITRENAIIWMPNFYCNTHFVAFLTSLCKAVICISSYCHHKIENINYYTPFRVRPFNNAIRETRCVLCYVFTNLCHGQIPSWNISHPGGLCFENGPVRYSITVLLGTIFMIGIQQMCFHR